MSVKKNDLPESLQYLPAEYRGAIEREGESQSFVRWLFQTFEGNLHFAERAAANSWMLMDPNHLWLYPAKVVREAHLDPKASETAPGWEWKRLEWLASCLALELEERWIANEDQSFLLADQPASAKKHAVHRLGQDHPVIKLAGHLYRLRGTPQGLKECVKVFCDLEVEILERSRPAHPRTETPPPRGYADEFIVLVRASEQNRKALQLEGEWVELGVAGEHADMRVRAMASWSASKTSAAIFSTCDNDAVEALLPRSLRKLCDVINREKPVHTTCYLAIESLPPHDVTNISSLILDDDDGIMDDYYLN